MEDHQHINRNTGRPLRLRGWAKMLSYPTVDLFLSIDCYNDDVQLAESAIKQGADVNAIMHGEGPSDSILHRAARCPNSDVLMLLVNQEPKPFLIRNTNGATPLHYCAEHTSVHIALPRLVASYGLVSDTSEVEGDTVLHCLMKNATMPAI